MKILYLSEIYPDVKRARAGLVYGVAERNNSARARALSVLLVSLSDFGLGRGLYLAEAFSKIGHNITVLTNYPVYSPKQYTRQKNPSNVKIVTFPSLSILYNSIIGRLIFYFWIMLWSFFFFVKHNSRFDVIYLRPPHPFTDFAAMIYKILNKKVVLISDITDLWPEALEYTRISGLSKVFWIRIGHLINQIVYAKLDLIITHNEIIASILKERSKKEVKIIYGAIDTDKFKPIKKEEALSKIPKNYKRLLVNKFIVLYAGLIGPFQNPKIIMQLAKMLVNEESIVFLIVGEGPLKENLLEESQKNDLSNIIFMPTQPFEKMPIIYNLADLVLLTYAPIKFLSIGLPKKFIEYAACGKPIICLTPYCVASRLCQEWEAGYHISPKNIEKCNEVIRILKENRELREQIGINARKMAENLFSLVRAERVLRSIIGEFQT